MEVITNNVPRDIVYGYELTDKERKEFDYIDFSTDSGVYHSFFRYKGEVYDLDEFMAFSSAIWTYEYDTRFNEWDGYQSDTFFSGILVKYVENFERVVVGRYYA